MVRAFRGPDAPVTEVFRRPETRKDLRAQSNERYRHKAP